LMDLARAVKEMRFEPETAIVREGEYDDCLYLVVEGVVQIVRGETLLSELAAGDFFGEIALLEGVARSANAVARTRVRLLGLDRVELMKQIDERPAIAVGLLRTLSRRVRELTDRVVV
jgi:CRP-like cAMP-binding protein